GDPRLRARHRAVAGPSRTRASQDGDRTMNDSEAKLRSALSQRAERVRVDDPAPKVQHRIVVRRKQRRQRFALGAGALPLLVAIAWIVPVVNDGTHSPPVAARATTTTAVAHAPGVLRSQLVRDTRPAVSAGTLKRFTDAGTQAALDLYHQLGKTNGNVFFS